MSEITYSLSDALRYTLAAVLLISALAKSRHPALFAQTIREYKLMPNAAAWPSSVTILAAESGLAAALLAGWHTTAAALAATVLFGVFAIAVLVNVARRRAVTCGCFGRQDEPISTRTLSRLALLMVASSALSWMTSFPSTSEPPIADWSMRTASALALGTGLLVAAAWLLYIPELWRFGRRSLTGDAHVLVNERDGGA